MLCSCIFSDLLLALERRVHASETIATYFVVVSSVGMNKVDCISLFHCKYYSSVLLSQALFGYILNITFQDIFWTSNYSRQLYDL